MGIFEDAAEAAALPGGPRPGALASVSDVAQLISVDGATQRATVSLRGSEPVELPYLPGVYTGYTTCLVLCDPMAGGRAVWVLGPVGVQAEPPAPPEPPAPGGTVTAAATILPTWSGTWRVSRGAWDRWNADRSSYGGRSTLYQGALGSSGTLKGLATYGDQVAGLGATVITSAVLTVPRIGDGLSAAALVTVQGSPHGTRPSGAPASSGETASSTSTALTLTAAQCEDLRTGSFKGLCLVGSAYAGVYGTAHAAGMALRVNYTRPA